METRDQSTFPQQPASMPGTDEPSPGTTLPEAALGAMFGIACRQSGPGEWEPPSPEELQADFPDYEIRGLLGRGGMGAVYRGWQKSLGRFVAIKILPPIADDGISDFAERFKREANAMAQLRHHGIVTVYGAGETSGGLLYFVMECVDGTDVQRMVTGQGRLEPGEALRITVAMCDALACAHGHGIIHRDIKPSNIMLDAGGAVKVADFGLAKCTAPGTASLTMTNVAMGTPEFMAPEALKDAAKVDHRADLYAVGVMLYYMLTGKIPLPGYVLPSRAVPGLDKRLDLILARTLRRDPAARYGSAGELRDAIEPILQRTVAKRTTAGSTGSRRRKMTVLFGIVAILGLAIPAAAIRWRRGANPVPSRPGAGDARAFGSYRYLVVKEQVSWAEAVARARAMGGNLASISSAGERDILDMICAKAMPRRLGLVWLGGIRTENGGPWTWVTGKPFIFTDWEPGKPRLSGAAWLTLAPVGEKGYAWKEMLQSTPDATKHVGGFVVEWAKPK